ncbi:MAG TPA: efflux RND transporter periplasmic adaptor subunit [Gemmatimonadales bacterium]|nr:efflux RND transporter periplasmic adaptor subunit [Gemmatimonadales bacterium]
MNRRSFWCALAVLGAACSSRAATTPPRVPVTVVRAERRSVPFQVEATGTIESMRSAAVVSQVGGLLLHVRFHEGDEVAQGQVLFEIDPRPFAAAVQQAEANLSRDLAQADAAVRDAARYATLAKDKFVTEEDYQAKQASADALTATVRADSAALTLARLNLGYATIRAPIAGRTGSLLLHEGNQVIANQSATPLVTINQLRPILVRFPVPATQLPELQRRAGQRLHVLVRPAQDTAVYQGDLAFVDNHVDATTGTVLLKGHFDNAGGRLWPGEFVDVTLVLGDQADALVVPAQAVMNAQQGTYVFLITPAGTAKQQPVQVQRTLDTLAVIARGVAPGDMVVIDGQSRLTADARVEVRGGPASEADPQPASSAKQKP